MKIEVLTKSILTLILSASSINAFADIGVSGQDDVLLQLGQNISQGAIVDDAMTTLTAQGDYMRSGITDLNISILGPINLEISEQRIGEKFDNLDSDRGTYRTGASYSDPSNLDRNIFETKTGAAAAFKF